MTRMATVRLKFPNRRWSQQSLMRQSRQTPASLFKMMVSRRSFHSLGRQSRMVRVMWKVHKMLTHLDYFSEWCFEHFAPDGNLVSCWFLMVKYHHHHHHHVAVMGSFQYLQVLVLLGENIANWWVCQSLGSSKFGKLPQTIYCFYHVFEKKDYKQTLHQTPVFIVACFLPKESFELCFGGSIAVRSQQELGERLTVCSESGKTHSAIRFKTQTSEHFFHVNVFKLLADLAACFVSISSMTARWVGSNFHTRVEERSRSYYYGSAGWEQCKSLQWFGPL